MRGQAQAQKVLRTMQSERGTKRAAEDEDDEQRMLKAKLVLEESVSGGFAKPFRSCSLETHMHTSMRDAPRTYYLWDA